jgi:2-keto-4-pentenoate hydratase/2-oxohepta-3-ene-1,7-dioic acid hydratase in catechol pathway
MLLYRVGPEGFYAVRTDEGEVRILFSDPYETAPGGWELGRKLEVEPRGLLAPVEPSKILGIGRNYVQHAKELGNPVPDEPVLFLKAPSSVIGPGAAVVLPPESDRVEFEGEIAVVLSRRLCRSSADEARSVR